MKLPTKEECIDLMKEYKLPANIVKHSMAVNKLSVFLAVKLRNSGIKVNVDLVDRASLLHDLDKMITLGKKSHGLETEKILKGMGYPELGKVAKKHKFSFIGKLGSWEEKIVNYADKRCLEDKIVPIEERFTYFKKRYGITEKQKQGLYFKLEKDIFSKTGIKQDSFEEKTGKIKRF